VGRPQFTNYFIGMKKSFLPQSSFFFALIVPFFLTAASAIGPENLDNAYFLGPTLILNLRNGYDDFSAIQTSVKTPRNDLLMYGAVGGKRFPLNKFMRLQVGLGFDMGSVVDDTLSATLIGRSGPSIIGVKHTFYHASVSPELQFFAPISEGAVPFVRIGGGMNFVWGNEQMFVLNSDTLVDGMVPQTVYNNQLCFDAMAGLGIDFRITHSLWFCFSYSFRFWQPVQGSIEEDFPLTELNYHEIFFSHGIQLTMLFDSK
jgi:hypothetical protein